MANVHDKAKLADKVKITHTKNNPAEVEKKEYVVTSSAGLFKNGKQYNKGATVLLDHQSAQNFIAIGDVKPKK